MSTNVAGQYVCLTTLEYAVRGSLMSTHCPSCGLRLVIKSDSLANRVASVSLLLGMSVLLGYHLGAHGQWIHKLSNRILRILGFRRDYDKGHGRMKALPSGLTGTNGHRNQLYSSLESSSNSGRLNGYQTNLAHGSDEMLYDDEMETRMSDLTCDSAIDMGISEDDIDEQLMELFNYNKLYSEFYNSSNSNAGLLARKGEEEDDDYRKRFRTGTVDRIDQVLQQVDDIKKSIVEIDDELYQIAGATYANFNPEFLTFTNVIDDFDRDDELYDSTSSRPAKLQVEGVNRKLATPKQNVAHLDDIPKEQPSAFNDGLPQSDSQSRASLSDLDSLQLEWDFDFESGYDYYDSQAIQSNSQERKQSPLREKLSSAANGLDMPMTDEQKLKNMHDLLDEAKRMGLLNNIIDALAPSEASVQSKHQQNASKPKIKSSKPSR